jgi:selenide, water dikinase
MLRILDEKGIKVKYNCEVTGVERGANGSPVLDCTNGEKIPFDEAVWCTQAAPQAWLKDTGLSLDADGFINVRTTLESTNTPDVFAAGDICCMVDNPRLKAGVFAVRAGAPLVNNLRRRVKGESPLEEWIPQEQFLGIIGTGDGYAIASRGPLALEGEYLWTLKDNIDQVWMSGYQELPVMDMTKKRKKKKTDDQEEEEEEDDEDDGDESDDEKTEQLAHAMGQEAIDLLTHSKMRCGGCGSKVGAQVLDRALSRVQHLISPRAEVVAGLGVSKGDDAALVRLPDKPNMLLVHTLDYFRSFVSDPFVFGRIAANHSLSDIHAMNGDAVTCLALCVIPFGPELKVEESLVQMLAGLCSFLKEENCSLVGGHTSEGGDNALGLAVNGVVEEGKELRKGPPRDGDVLILTKPLGTGTILAADMRASAKGNWVQGALDNMQVSNRRAAAILGEHECHGCTDVTGFGLVGHMLEMMKHTLPSDDKPEHSVLQDDDACCRKPVGSAEVCSVTINLEDVPLLDGAKQCVAAGVFSSLHPSNIRCARAVENPEDGKDSLVYPLLFDPQVMYTCMHTTRHCMHARLCCAALRCCFCLKSYLTSRNCFLNSADGGWVAGVRALALCHRGAGSPARGRLHPCRCHWLL